MLYGTLVGVAAVMGAVAFVCVVVLAVAARRATGPRPPAGWRHPPGYATLGKLAVFHCTCGARVVLPVSDPVDPVYPVCCGCWKPVHGRNLPRSVEDAARFIESMWGLPRS